MTLLTNAAWCVLLTACFSLPCAAANLDEEYQEVFELLDKGEQGSATLRALGSERGVLAEEAYLQATQRALSHPGFIGETGELGMHKWLLEPALSHDSLQADGAFLSVLEQALAAGVITGYDLRRKHVYADFPTGSYFIYSHQSTQHISQLAAVMAASDLHARVFVEPKVSAFLYREGWGGDPSQLAQLPGGTRVVKGEEMAVLFEFDTPGDRHDFHTVVEKYAKKDAEDEPGLIAKAWWQPFYYSDSAMTGFASITLVVVSSDTHEATLTVVHEKADKVFNALSGKGYEVTRETVWVNPPFYRFLQGDFR